MEKLYSLNIKCIIQSIRDEGWPFIFICLYLFFEYVRPQSIYTAIDILPFVPIILVLAFIGALTAGEFGKSFPSVLNKLIVVYAVVVLLSSIMSQYSAVSFAKLRSFFDWFIIYFLIVNIVTNERRFFLYLSAFLLFSFKMSQHGFLTWAKRGFSFSGWGITGAPGWFHNSGEVGIQMCIFVPLSFFFVLAIRNYISKKWLVFLSLMPVTGVGTAIASSSRGALVGLGGSALWSLLKRPKIFILGGIFVGLVAWIVYYAVPPEFMERFETAGNDRTSLLRMERWEHGWDTMKKYPFLGIGFEAWTEYYPNKYHPEHEGTPLVHNIFVQCGTELGFTGLSVFVAMILCCFLVTRRVRKMAQGHQDKFLAIISYGFDSALMGFLISGSLVTVLYYPYFWIHCAMTTCLNTAAHKKYLA